MVGPSVALQLSPFTPGLDLCRRYRDVYGSEERDASADGRVETTVKDAVRIWIWEAGELYWA